VLPIENTASLRRGLRLVAAHRPRPAGANNRKHRLAQKRIKTGRECPRLPQFRPTIENTASLRRGLRHNNLHSSSFPRPLIENTASLRRGLRRTPAAVERTSLVFNRKHRLAQKRIKTPRSAARVVAAHRHRKHRLAQKRIKTNRWLLDNYRQQHIENTASLRRGLRPGAIRAAIPRIR